MKMKYIPLVRYNPHNKIFKWEYDYKIEYIYEEDEKHPPSPRPVKASENIFGTPARLTKNWAIRAATKRARSMQKLMDQRKLEWERA